MSDDSFSVTSEESWFSRLGNAIKGILLGIILFIASFPLLWWNEGRAVVTAKSLKELGGSVVSVSATKVDPANDGKAVHMTAEATTTETLKDPEFPVSETGIKLRRKAEMYQWKEKIEEKTEKKVGGATTTKKTPSYEKTWSSDAIASDSFERKDGHTNPTSMRVQKAEQTAGKVQFGAFTLSPGLVNGMNDYKPVAFTAEMIESLPAAEKDCAVVEGGALYLGADGKKKANPKSPEIGDLKVSFEVVKPGTASIIAQQNGSTFQAWRSSIAGAPAVETLMMGTLDAAAMVEKKEQENTIMTWVLRLVGFLLMAFGIGLVLSPLGVLADVVPILGDLMRAGTGLFAGVVALLLSLMTIAAAWFFYRPVLAVGLLLAGVAVFAAAWKLFAKKKPAPAQV